MSPTLTGEGEQASLAQHGIWVTERMGCGGQVYHMPLAIRFDGPLDTDRLLAACHDVVGAHPQLATALAERDAVLRPALAAVPPPIGFEDASGREAGELVDREASLDLDLGTGPTARFRLFRLAPERHLLVVVAHHAVFDGMSKDLLVRGLADAYAGLPLPVLPLTYGEAVERENARVAELLDEAAAFWRDRWQDRQDLRLPGLSGVSTRAAAGEAVDFALPAGLAVAAEKMGVTRFELVLTAVHTLLAAYGNEDAAVSVDLSTRTEETRDHIGLFVNELPVRAGTPSGTFADFARSVRGELRAVYRFRQVPLARAVGGVSPRTALTPVSVSYRGRDGSAPEFPGVAASVDWMSFNHAVRGTLHLQVVDAPDGITARLQFNPAVLSRSGCESLVEHLLDLLEAVATAPDTEISHLPLPAPVEVTVDVPAGPSSVRTEAEPAAVPRAGEADATPYLAEVAEIWSEVFKRPGIGPDEDLFDLGGHSLTIVEIIAKVRERMDVELSFDLFFDEPTIAGVAAEVALLREEAC
ncbi:condensation domain-containing protein [Microbispora sp. H10949]|uniref:condensation domain-containing protein n=1 Tax=Microbispora sp. H10949 TaxID=2729111 RepID=UPI0016026E9D|nr:condensation domain-containing protein [Microbispora sp. H10949]